jgi:FixJ family two-component response regulator
MTGLIFLIDDTGGNQVEMTIAAMQRAGHWLPLVTIAENPDAQSVVRAMKAGALDFMVMPTAIAPINACIARVMAEAELLRAQHNRSAEARARLQRLSAREREVLDHLVDGASNKSIARMLDLSPRTVEIHRTKMMGKLGVRSAAEAVRMRFEAGGLEAA